jgi:multicomponent Na+:H+ antiporter subunit E
MNLFVVNLLLASIWGAMSGVFTLPNLVLGYSLAFLVLLSLRRILPPSRYFSRIRQFASFVLYYLRNLMLANLRVAYDVVTPPLHMRPAIIAVPLDARTDLEITMLANLVTMTPGSFSVDIAEDRRTLYVHAMFAADPDAVRREIKDGLERRVLELLR